MQLKTGFLTIIIIAVIVLATAIILRKQKDDVSRFYGTWEYTDSNAHKCDSFKLNIFPDKEGKWLNGTYRWSFLKCRRVREGWIKPISVKGVDTLIVAADNYLYGSGKYTATVTWLNDSTIKFISGTNYLDTMELKKTGGGVLQNKVDIDSIREQWKKSLHNNDIYGCWSWKGGAGDVFSLSISSNRQSSSYGNCIYTFYNGNRIYTGNVNSVNLEGQSAILVLSNEYFIKEEHAKFKIDLLSDSTIFFRAVNKKDALGFPDSIIMQRNCPDSEVSIGL